MRVIWGLGFVLVIALGWWVGTRDGEGVQAAGSAGFLKPMEASPQAAPAAPTQSTTPSPKLPQVSAPQPPSPVPAAAAAKPRVGSSVEESEIAAAVLHCPWTEVSVRVSQSKLSEDRRHLIAAFSAAVGGATDQAKGFAKGLERSDEVSERERALLAAALSGSAVGPTPAGTPADSVTAFAFELTLRARDAARWLAEGRFAEAAQAYSDVLKADATATWPADRAALQRWSEGVASAQLGHRWNVKGKWPSVETTVKPGDSLTVIRKRVLKEHPEILVCTGLIERVNQLRSAESIHPGDVLRIPTERPHMLVDISTRWVMYMMGDEVVAAWESGVGKPGNDTVPGRYTIGLKQRNPSWFRPGAALVPFGDPENPLGTRWLSWRENGVESHLGFHGTTDPSSVGGAVSSGCVRLRNEDVEVLFEILPEQAEVLVQP